MTKLGKKILVNFIIMTLGAFVYAFGVSVFLEPHNFAPGGVTGIAIIISHFTSLDAGLLVLILNIPLIIAGLIRFGREFLFSTVYSTVLSGVLISAITRFINHYSFTPPQDFLLCAITGGVIMGVGLGIIFRQGGTTGGIDIVVKFLRQKYRHLKSGVLFIILDSVVVTASAIVYKSLEMGLYAGIAVFVASIAFNATLYGTDSARLVYIVSDNPEKISKRLLKDLDIGVTYIHGEGGYTHKAKRVILCAAKNRVFPLVKQIVREEDPAAFMIVSSANEIYGEGFKENSSTEL
ncbi:MAG: YitT family protein [Eubacteriales bacterium]|jgi:uncharacterized membrane-anchored protein YitT (DUF2179 family)